MDTGTPHFPSPCWVFYNLWFSRMDENRCFAPGSWHYDGRDKKSSYSCCAGLLYRTFVSDGPLPNLKGESLLHQGQPFYCIAFIWNLRNSKLNMTALPLALLTASFYMTLKTSKERWLGWATELTFVPYCTVIGSDWSRTRCNDATICQQNSVGRL